MRILFLSNFFPPHQVGGYEMLCADVRERLRARGHRIDVLTSRHGVNDCGSSEDGVHRLLHLEVDLRPWQGTLGFFTDRGRQLDANARHLEALIEQTQPDVLMVWGMWNLPRSLLAAAERRRRPPLAYYVADYWPTLSDAYELHWQAPALHWWTRLPKAALGGLINRLRQAPPAPALSFAHTACVSAAVRQRLIDAGLPFDRAMVIHNGIDPQRFPFRSRPNRSGDDSLRVGYAGRLDPEKGIAIILQALALLARRGETLDLTVAGGSTDARHESALRAEIDRLALRDRVTMCGQVPAEQMPALFAELDVLVVPSTWPEPLARVIQEAMASGAVVVAAAVGGTGEIVADGVNGLLCAPGDVEGLAACLTRLHADPALRSTLAHAARQTVETRFDLTRTVDAIERMLVAVAAH